MEQTGCSETSAYKIQAPGYYPEEIMQHSEHDESLKSRRSCDVINCVTVYSDIGLERLRETTETWIFYSRGLKPGYPECREEKQYIKYQ
jgi:hypothetical protein